MSSRGDSLSAPPGAARVPVLVILAVLVAVGVALLVGLTDGGWYVLLMLPVALFCLWVLVRVVASMRPKSR